MADPITLALLGSSFLGGILGKDKRKQTQTGTSTTTPTFDPAFMGVRDRLLRSSMRAPGGFSLARNITNQRLQGIGSAAGSAETGLRAKLAAMGQRGPAAGFALAGLGERAFGEKVGAINDEPLLAHGFDQEQLQQLLEVLGMGRGSATKTEGTATGESGGGIGQGFADVGEMLGWLAANGKLGKKTMAGGGV